jgi:endonuclease VIII
MPEGDTIHKVTTFIQTVTDNSVTRLTFVRGIADTQLNSLSKEHLVAAQAVGKHTLLDFSNGQSLRVHLGMHGIWSKSDSNKLKPFWDRGVRLEVRPEQGNEFVLVCDQPKELEFFATRDRDRVLDRCRVGPDLLGQTYNPLESLKLAKIHCRPDLALSELLSLQLVASGMGNVYRNELCYMGPLETDPFKPSSGLSPFQPWRSLSDEQLLGLWNRARLLMLANLGGWQRTTTFDPRPGAPINHKSPRRLWVYESQGKACLVCRTKIASRHFGDYARATHWCPSCQPKFSPPPN